MAVDFYVTFRDYFLGKSELTALIGTRIDYRSLPTDYDPVFPNVSIEVQSGGVPVPPILEKIPLIMKAHSRLHFDEAHDVLGIVIKVLQDDGWCIPNLGQAVFVNSPGEDYNAVGGFSTAFARFSVDRIST